MSAIMISTRNESTLILTLAEREPAQLSASVMENALQCLRNAERDESIRAVILCGNGGDFCRGRALPQQSAECAGQSGHDMELLAQWVRALREYPKPVVAAVEGVALDGGFALALACDFIIAAQSAQFAVTQLKLGLTPDGGLTWLLMRQMPRQLATELLMESKPMLAARMHQLGVVKQIVEDGKAQSTALRFCQKLAELPPFAVERLKELVNEAHDNTLEQQFAAEQHAHLSCLHHHEAEEGLAARIEKRKPRFR
ncbi:enoyl-CoA hydratase-related protein [Massilia sp. W12]|uniref:enoyl-CoA hydratase-related protein n=1 Tax=Massilia sp. W12 TaxID=3126507 RepID=UPI0030D4BD33